MYLKQKRKVRLKNNKNTKKESTFVDKGSPSITWFIKLPSENAIFSGAIDSQQVLYFTFM